MPVDKPAWHPTYVLLTCEHGGRDVPAPYARLFKGARGVLEGHRGYDIGALGVAFRLASHLSSPIIFSTTTRLLVELNRSIEHPHLFSEFTRGAPESDRDAIIASYYMPYRNQVEATIAAAVFAGHQVLHIGVHSFTDVLDDHVRDVDSAFLYDPARPSESSIAAIWRTELGRRTEGRIRANKPYKGTDDGLTTSLRAKFPAEAYAGIEIEVRQGLIRNRREQIRAGDLFGASFDALISREGSPVGSTRHAPKTPGGANG